MADRIRALVEGRKAPERYRYRDKGSLAVIGRNAAVAAIGRWRLHGLPAWLVWILIHILYLIGYESKLLVMVQWAWSYLTRNAEARLITPETPLPPIDTPPAALSGDGPDANAPPAEPHARTAAPPPGPR